MQASASKTFLFAHNPADYINETRSYGKELRYLTESTGRGGLGYVISSHVNELGYYTATKLG